MDLLNITPQQWLEKEEELLEVLLSKDVWNKVPLLNVNDLHNFKDLQLVKFEGMIQDIHGPEYFLEKYEVINEDTRESSMKYGKFIDLTDCQPNETINLEGPSTVRAERQAYVAISVPGLNPWVKNIQQEKHKLPVSVATPTTTQTKRPLEEDSEQMDTNTPHVEKRQCPKPPSTDIQPNSVISPESLLNFPIPDPTGKVCHVKVYKNAELLKLNSMCEFVGFLSVDPALACQGNEEEMNEIEFQTHHPPPSLIPRLHCVAFKSIPHHNPLVEEISIAPERMQFLKKELLIVLTQLMCGDELAAEYLIYHLISEVYLRKDFMALGKFSVNISHVPMLENLDYVKELYSFIELLVTKSHYMGMSLENMNELTFVPKKDYASNRIDSSVLQLSTNTHFLLDETKLSNGKLNEAGVEGVKTLANVIKNQKIMYDFTYYKIEFDCDIPFLVLSEGKSMLPSDCHVILKPDEMHLNTFREIVEAAKHFLKPELLNELRVYLTTARLAKYEIMDNIQDLVQKEFVEMRQKGSVSGDDLHNLLVLARLVCISEGKTALDEECFKKACTLEDTRKSRFPKTN